MLRAAKELEKIPGASNIRLAKPRMTTPVGVGEMEKYGGRGGREREGEGTVEAIEGVGYGEPGRELEQGGTGEGVGYSDRGTFFSFSSLPSFNR